MLRGYWSVVLPDLFADRSFVAAGCRGGELARRTRVALGGKAEGPLDGGKAGSQEARARAVLAILLLEGLRAVQRPSRATRFGVTRFSGIVPRLEGWRDSLIGKTKPTATPCPSTGG